MAFLFHLPRARLPKAMNAVQNSVILRIFFFLLSIAWGSVLSGGRRHRIIWSARCIYHHSSSGVLRTCYNNVVRRSSQLYILLAQTHTHYYSHPVYLRPRCDLDDRKASKPCSIVSKRNQTGWSEPLRENWHFSNDLLVHFLPPFFSFSPSSSAKEGKKAICKERTLENTLRLMLMLLRSFQIRDFDEVIISKLEEILVLIYALSQANFLFLPDFRKNGKW